MIYGMLYIWLAISVLTCQSSMSDVKPTCTVVDSDKLQAAIKKLFSSMGWYSAV